MLPIFKTMQKLAICTLMVVFAATITASAQTTPPTWWFGVSGAANLNFYDGTTQTLNSTLIAPTALHKGFGARPYGSILMEYRPGRVWGFMLNVGYDGRGAQYDNVVAPCNCLVTLKADIDYVAVEPSLRLGFQKNNLFFFAGPRLAFNITDAFAYTQVRQPNTNGNFSNIKSTEFSGQVGMGYDFMVSAPASTTMVSLSPFVSYQPYFGQEPRNIESLSITTVRVGIALKFGKVHRVKTEPAPTATAVPAPVHDFNLVVNAPKGVAAKRRVSETLPLLNVVFFDDGSVQVPARYVALTVDQATGFKEEQLQNAQTDTKSVRSAGQLNVYYNVLNILGARMRANPATTITLEGASAKGPEEGKEMASAVKTYLVTVFGIEGSRITVRGSYKPIVPSQQKGATKDIALLRAEDNRVDIATSSPELLVEVGGGMMKPVRLDAMQVNPMDSEVVLKVDSAKQLLKSWSVDVTDSAGVVQHYGPYTDDQEGISGKMILGTRQQGDYKVVMLAETNSGATIKRESTVHLVSADESEEVGLRYSIVFDFDKAKTIAAYDRFLTDVVAPLIADGATVIIHGHTDIVGEEAYNQKLSESRAQHTQAVIEHALKNKGKNNVKFETLGFGEDVNHSPFDNDLPEQRFYNRTVIIDIVPVK